MTAYFTPVCSCASVHENADRSLIRRNSFEERLIADLTAGNRVDL
jgi:hypothetical protein